MERDQQSWSDEVQKIVMAFVGGDADLGMLMLDHANNYWDRCFADGLTPQEGLASLIKRMEERHGSLSGTVAAFKKMQNDTNEFFAAQEALREQERTSWFVYCIHEPQTHRTKIGTSRDPYARLKQHQTGSPTKLELSGYFAGGRRAETIFLRCFYDRRIVMHERMTEWMKDDDGAIVENFRQVSDGWKAGNALVISRGRIERRG